MSGEPTGDGRGHGARGSRADEPASVSLDGRAERRLIELGGAERYVEFTVRVAEATRPPAERTPLTLAIVLDRSGSMAGEKLETAKRATLAVIEQLDRRDRVALVIFDDRIEVLQPATALTSTVKSRLREALGAVQARASTALHEGWLSGCQAIADDGGMSAGGTLARCFLLTDGLANVGLTDPEQIASEAAGISRNAGIGTSTFGIGPDYDEHLLGPMAVAGGGQFHHLRTPAEIASTFVGELGGLLGVAAQRVRLELALDAGITAEVISAYWVEESPGQLSVAVGDLPAGDERHVVVRFGFPAGEDGLDRTVRARLVWLAEGIERQGEWRALSFAHASAAACAAEPRDPAVMHWVGLHQADRAERQATELNRRGDFAGAAQAVARAAGEIAQFAGNDAALSTAVAELQAARPTVAAPMAPMAAKEMYATSQRRSRAQRDFRRG